LRAGPIETLRNKKRETAADVAVASGHPEIVQLLKIAMIGISDIGSAAEKEDSHPMSLTVVTAVYAVAIGAIWTLYIVLRRRAEARSRATKEAAAEAGLLEPASLHPKVDRRNV